MAVGVALSPMPIIAVVLLLTTAGARRNGPAFVVGRLTGLAVIGVIVLAIAGPAVVSDQGQPATWVTWLKLVLGILLLLVAAQQFAGRPAADAEPTMPNWLQSIDRFGAARSLGTGAALTGLNPKNFLLAVSAGTAIAQTGIPGVQQAVAYGVFALIGTLSVGAPVVFYLAMGDKSATTLAAVKDWMGRHNAVIMSVVCLVIGVKLIGDFVSGLGV
ncbi:GAP family protein [Actinoplanes sp. NPDC026623]|uniref:GAP family protein n=1 Tax=Actinoplanes sp. NPDC026623 TaxID=3155610 RepID=UPI0033E18175